MRKSILITLILLLSTRLLALNITIVESSAGMAWAKQDSVWQTVATTMGYNATIAPQTILSDVSNLTSCDVLIISSATKGFSSESYLQTIKQFVVGGRPVYIQSEYLRSAPGNVVFDTLMHMVGAGFQWGTSTTGQLAPMNVLGGFASMPNSVSAIAYFNAGLAGEGSGVDKFLEFNGKFYGFYYHDPAGVMGTVITTSDQDWIWHNESPALMGNILFRLANSTTTRIRWKDINEDAFLLFPNPATDWVTIEAQENSVQDVHISNLLGQKVIEVPVFRQIARFRLPAGVYHVSLKTDYSISSKKLVVQ